jgi:hypothetical protein
LHGGSSGPLLPLHHLPKVDVSAVVLLVGGTRMAPTLSPTVQLEVPDDCYNVDFLLFIWKFNIFLFLTPNIPNNMFVSIVSTGSSQ